MRRLAKFVHVDGQQFRPGDVPPPEVACRITNPKCWEGDPDPAESVEQPTQAETPAAEAVQEKQDPEPPPRAGKGSGHDAWAAYAAAKGVEVPEGAGRDEIIAAVEAAE